MSGWVTVTGPPASICFRKRGMTLPRLPSTLPNRTATNFVRLMPSMYWMYISARRFEAPMTLVGFTALSVEIMTKICTPCQLAARAVFIVPIRLFFTASSGLRSISGTCLCAAAW